MIINQHLQHCMKAIVTVNDADFLGRAKPSAIMGYFQDIATEHANILGIGYDEMSAQNLGWIMIRMSFKALRCPRIGDELTVQTFPERPNNFDVNRGYYIFDDKGDAIVLGSSKWCVLSIDSQRLQRCAPLFTHFEDDVFIPNQPFDDANPKLNFVADSSGPMVKVFEQGVRLTELDRNMHMNNARYGDIMFNAFDFEYLKGHRIARLDVNFLAQLFVGDSYEVYRGYADNVAHVEAVKSGTDTVLFRARAEFCEE
jgi:acyl-ACP thioesterase